MHFRHYYIAALSFFVTSSHAFSQERSLRFNHITAKEGLPYSDIRKLYTASNNMVWISTGEGLYYYDGKKAKRFPVPDPAIFFGGWTNYIVEGKNNRLYVGSVKGIMIIDSKDLTAYIPPLYKVKDNFQPNYTEPLCEDKNGFLWLYTGFNTASLYKLNLKDTSLQFVINDINGVLSIIKDNNTGSPVGIWFRENRGAYYLSLTGNNAKITNIFFAGGKTPGPSFYINDIIADDTTGAWLATLHGLYYVNRQTGEYKLCNLGSEGQITNVRSLAQRKNGWIYCATGDDGILVYDPASDKLVTQYKHYDQDRWSIAGNNIEYIYIDDKDHLFAGIANQGISYASFSDESQLYYKLLTPQNEPALSFNDKVIAAAVQKDLTYLYVEEKGIIITNKQHIVQKIFPNEYTGTVNQLFTNNMDTVWAATDKGLFYLLNDRLIAVPVAAGIHTPRLYSVQASSGNVITATGDEGIYFVETDNAARHLKKYTIYPKTNYPFFINMFEYEKERFLLNTKYTSFYRGTLRHDTITLEKETYAADIVPLAYRKLTDDKIIIGCNSGIYLYNTRLDSFLKITGEKDGPYISYLFDRDKIYAVSQTCVTVFETTEKDNSIKVTDMQHIIPGSYSSFIKTGALKWISGTSGGLMQFDAGRSAENFHFIFSGGDNKKNSWHSLTVSDSLLLSLQDEKKFSVSANNFTGGPANLYYMEDGREKWQAFANGEMISVEDLDAGWHTLVFNTFPGKRGSVSKIIFIPTPWHRKWWFVFSMILLAAVSIYFIAKKVYKNMQKAAGTRQHIVETEMAALKAQMNPHFMFNCINSIDAFIQSNDKYNATLYLNKFAKLIRNVLESSKANLVFFSTDIETLKLYIELEELRNENKFTTQLTIDEELMNSDYKVPPLIIQPFVENAIIHGLKNRDDNEGRLIITIQKRNNSIEYIIRDNGIGRQAAAKIVQNKTSHFGVSMSYDRIKLFNKEKDASVDIQDIYENGDAAGTFIKININIV